MAYTVIEDFTDDKAGGRVYRKGDAFPEEGLTVTEERLKELSTKENKRKTILIEEVVEKVNLEDETVADLKVLADEKELEYDPKIKKADLIKLLDK